MSDAARQILDQRKANMRIAGRIYANMQRAALGIEAKPAKDRGMGLKL